MSNRQTGTVKWFNLIEKASASSLHNPVTTSVRSLQSCQSDGFKSLKEGQQVSFSVATPRSERHAS